MEKELCRLSLPIWKHLAQTGDNSKPDFSYKYDCGCPFCEVYQNAPGYETFCFDCDLTSSIGGISNMPFACEKQGSTYYARWRALRATHNNRATRKRRSWAWAMVNALETELLGFRS